MADALPRGALLALTLLASLPGCQRAASEADIPGPDAAEVIVLPAEANLRVGERVQLAAQVNDAQGRAIGGAEIHYRNDTPEVLSVSVYGTLGAVGPVGEGFVTVISGVRERRVPVRVSAGVLQRIERVSGDGQVAAAGTLLPERLQVRALDQSGNPVPQAQVWFADAADPDRVPMQAGTDAGGEAGVQFRLGSQAGVRAIRVSSPTHPTAVLTFTATAEAGPPAQLAALALPEAAHAVGSSVTAAVRAVDAFGNPVAGVMLDWHVDGGAGVVEPSSSMTDSGGVAQAIWRLGTRAALNRLRANVKSGELSPAWLEVAARAGAPVELSTVRGARQTARKGSAVSVLPVVRVVDSHGNPVAGVRVDFQSSAGTSQFEPVSGVTDDQGQAGLTYWQVDSASAELVARVPDTALAATLAVRAR